MKVWKILVFWVLTVLIGGIIYPLLAYLSELIFNDSSHMGVMDVDLESIGAIMAVAAITSIPTILILIILHFIGLKNRWERKLYALVLLTVQFICGIITFLIIGNEIREFEFTFSLYLAFAPLGLIVWTIFIFKSPWWLTSSSDFLDDIS